MAPLLFLIVAEGLSRSLINTKRTKRFTGVSIGGSFNLSNHLFVDDILIFCDSFRRDLDKLREILHIYCAAIGILENSLINMIFPL